MKRIVIFGYFGRGNLGDETNLAQLVSFLQKDFSKIGISVISSAPALIKNVADTNVNATGKFNIIGILRLMMRADILIGGGGSLFQDRTSVRSLLYYTGLVLLAKLFKVKVFLYGQGIGPVRSGAGKRAAGWALSMSDVITVRDRLSLIALAELNVERPEIHVTAEPLLLKNHLPEAVINEYWTETISRKPFKVGLILQDFRFPDHCFWKQTIEFLCLRRDIEIYLLSVDRKDLRFQERLAGESGVTILPIPHRWEEFQAAAGGMDLLVSARLHGLVAAVVQNIPCYGLAADPKIEGFCLQLGISFTLLATEIEPYHLTNRILKLLEEPEAERKPWHSQLPFWKARALENQLILKEFIAKNNDP